MDDIKNREAATNDDRIPNNMEVISEKYLNCFGLEIKDKSGCEGYVGLSSGVDFAMSDAGTSTTLMGETTMARMVGCSDCLMSAISSWMVFELGGYVINRLVRTYLASCRTSPSVS